MIFRFLSHLLSAPAVAVLVTIIFSQFSPDALTSIIVGVLFLAAIPSIPVFYFFEEGVVDIDIRNRKRRTLFFFFAILNYIAAALIFYYLGDRLMFLISLAYFLVTCSIALINLFWKISVHAAGVAGPTTALVYIFGKEIIPLYIFTIVIIYVRIKLKMHSLSQLLAGTIVAIAMTFLTYYLFY